MKCFWNKMLMCRCETARSCMRTDLEIWPVGLALRAGSRLTLTIQGKDFERPAATGPLRGVAWFTHDDPTDRPSELFAGTNSIHTGGPHQSYLLLPMLPSR